MKIGANIIKIKKKNQNKIYGKEKRKSNWVKRTNLEEKRLGHYALKPHSNPWGEEEEEDSFNFSSFVIDDEEANEAEVISWEKNDVFSENGEVVFPNDVFFETYMWY